MKLKTNLLIINQICLLLFCIKIVAQEKRVELSGTVKQDSILLKDINIINKTTNSGTSSNQNGTFIIYATLGDSILFSSINYFNRILKITKTHINNKSIEVYLEPGYNELDEILLEHKMTLNLGKIDMQKGIILDNTNNTYKKPPNIRKLTDPTYGNSGVNILGLVFKLVDVVFFKKRKLEKKQEKRTLKIKEKNQLNFIDNLVVNFGESFFINELKIHPDKIYLFIDYCEENKLKEHYDSNEFVIKNFLIIQSKKFNNINP